MSPRTRRAHTVLAWTFPYALMVAYAAALAFRMGV